MKETAREGFLLQTHAIRRVIQTETGRYHWGGRVSGLAARPGTRSPGRFGRTTSGFQNGAVWYGGVAGERLRKEVLKVSKATQLGDLLLWLWKSRSRRKREADQEGAGKDGGPAAWKSRW